MTAQTIRIKNGIVVLPKQFRQNWKNREVILFPSRDTLIIKKLRKPLLKLSVLADKAASPRISSKEISKEILAYRRKR